MIEAMNFEQSLISSGYDVVGIASTGEQALKKVAELKPDLIIMDIILKGEMDGIEVAAQVKEDFDVPVVYLTAHPEESTLNRAKLTSPFGYIIKPVNKTDLRNTIELALYKHQMEGKLKKSERFYRRLFENMLEGFAHCKMIFDEQGNPVDWVYLDVNHSFEQLTGLKNIIGKRVIEAIPNIRDVNPELFEIYGRVALTGHSEVFEIFFQPLKIWLNVSVFSPAKEHFIAVFNDVTENKIAKERIERLYRLYATLSQINQSVVRIKDKKELFETICNVCVEFGKFKMAWIGLIDETGNVRPVTHSGYEEGYLDKINININDEPSINKPTTLAINKGKVTIIEDIKMELHRKWSDNALLRGYRSLAVIPLKLKGEVVGNLNIYASESDFFNEDEIDLAEEIGTDISYAMDSIESEKELEIANKALSESERSYRELVDNSMVAVYKSNLKGQILFANEAMAKIFNFRSVEDLKAINAINLYSNPQDRQKIIEKLKEEGDFDQYELEMKSSKGEKINIILSANLSDDMISGMMMDITRRKDAEKKIKNQYYRLEGIMESSNSPIFSVDRKYNYTSFNKKHVELMKTLYGVNIEIGKNTLDYITIEEDRLKSKSNLDKALDGNQFTTEACYGDEAQLRLYFEISHNPIKDKDGNVSGVALYAQDITQRKKMEKNLKRNEERFRALIYNSTDLIRILDEDGLIIFDSPSSQRILGYREGYFIGKSPLDFIHPDDQAKVKKELEIVYKKKNPGIPTEFRIRKSDGTYIPVETVAHNLTDDPAVKGVVITTHPLSDRKKAEEALLESERRLTDIINFLPDATFAIDLEGKVIAWNRAIEEMTSTPKEEIMGKGNYEYSIPWYGERRPILIDLIGSEDSEFTSKYDFIQKKGQTLTTEVFVPSVYGGKGAYLWGKASPLLDSKGQQYGAIESVRDITNRKKAENALKRSEKRFRAVAESAVDAIVTTDANGKILFCNDSLGTIFGYSHNEIIGSNLTVLMPSRFRKEYLKGLETFKSSGEHRRVGKTLKTRGLRKNGAEFPFEMSLAAWKSGGNNFFTSIIRDITERDKAEDQIKKSLEEKEILLKEIHHRVKNNLQIISSLLDLQEVYVKEDPTAVNVLRESQNRVLSMAMIHEMLYQSTDLSHIDFSDYIRNMVSNLFHTYGVKNRITTVTDVKKAFLNVETSVPLGLIISELVSNSLKYAFPGDRGGKLLVSLHGKDEKFELIIEDDGVGLPENFDFRNVETSLGLRLVNSLVNQLDGSIELDKSNGTKFIIRFCELEYQERM